MTRRKISLVGIAILRLLSDNFIVVHTRGVPL